MLVLSRRTGESIVLPGCNVTVTVAKVVGNRVKLSVAAPAEIAVHRGEVWDRVRDSELAAAGPSAGRRAG